MCSSASMAKASQTSPTNGRPASPLLSTKCRPTSANRNRAFACSSAMCSVLTAPPRAEKAPLSLSRVTHAPRHKGALNRIVAARQSPRERSSKMELPVPWRGLPAPTGGSKYGGCSPRSIGGTRQHAGDLASGEIDQRDDARVVHAGRSDDGERTEHLVADPVGRCHHRDVWHARELALGADEDLHLPRAQHLVEHAQDVVLLGEGLEQRPRLLHIGELGRIEEALLAV